MLFKKEKPKEVEKDYSIDIAKEKEENALAPAFKVNINHTTIPNDVEKYSRKQVSGFSFNLIDNNHLSISVTPTNNFKECDQEFRNALGTLTNYRLTLRDADEIIKKYERYLSDHQLESQYCQSVKRGM